jgi:hypothetical protein
VVTSNLDCGHRVGNFHNYYSFHEPSARIVLFMKSGVAVQLEEEKSEGNVVTGSDTEADSNEQQDKTDILPR